MSSSSQSEPSQTDFLPLNGTDHIEFYVGNAKQAAHFYKTAFGFQSTAYCGPETGVRDRVSYVLQQDKIRFVLTTPLNSKSELNTHILNHGDGVKILALWVDDAYDAFEQTTKRGARVYQEPKTFSDENGEVRTSGIYTYEEVTKFKNAGAVGVPMKDLKGWLALDAEKRNNPNVIKGIPKDTVLVGNELADWLISSKKAYQAIVEKPAIIAIKGDKDTDYPSVRAVVKTFELKKILRFNFVTSLEGKEETADK